MSGLNRNFYQGNLSELLASYLLSKIGIATPVQRQFDIGTDFYCNLMDSDDPYLTFGNPYAIQIKSISAHPKVEYGADDPSKWKSRNITSLFENQIPFFIGLIDKDKTSIKIFDTTGLWQLYNLKPVLNCSKISLTTLAHPVIEWRNNVLSSPLSGWEGSEADGREHTIDMGNPIIEFSDKDSKEDLLKKSEVLRKIIILEQENITNRNLGVRCFREVKKNGVNTYEYNQWGMNLGDEYGVGYVDKIYESTRLALMTLSNNLHKQGRLNEYEAIINVLGYIYPAPWYDQLYKDDPSQFAWMNDMLKLPKDRRKLL